MALNVKKEAPVPPEAEATAKILKAKKVAFRARRKRKRRGRRRKRRRRGKEGKKRKRKKRRKREGQEKVEGAKEDSHITHLLEAQDRSTLKGAQIFLGKAAPRKSKLDHYALAKFFLTTKSLLR